MSALVLIRSITVNKLVHMSKDVEINLKTQSVFYLLFHNLGNHWWLVPVSSLKLCSNGLR